MDARSAECVDAVRAGDLLLGNDEWGARWIAASARSRRRQRVSTRGRRPAQRPVRRAAARPGPAPLRAGRRDVEGGARAGGHDGLRRGELERHRDRLDLRWARDVQEVQGAGGRRATPAPPVDPRAFSLEELRAGWRLACRAAADEDLVVEVPPLQTRPKAALVGVGRHVILRPAVQKRYLELSEPTLEDQTPGSRPRAGRDGRRRAARAARPAARPRRGRCASRTAA